MLFAFFLPPCITEIRTEVTEAKQGDIFISNSYRENCTAMSDKAKFISISIQFSFNWLEFPLFCFEWSSGTRNTNGKLLISCVSAFLFSLCFRYRDCCRRNCQLYVWRSTALCVASSPVPSRKQAPAAPTWLPVTAASGLPPQEPSPLPSSLVFTEKFLQSSQMANCNNISPYPLYLRTTLETQNVTDLL